MASPLHTRYADRSIIKQMRRTGKAYNTDMPKIAFNKTALKKERDQLKLYRQFLPSLDMKRQQFLLEQKKARQLVRQSIDELRTLHANAEEWLPFLADERLDVAGIVKVDDVRFGEENVLGLSLPTVMDVTVSVTPYSTVTTPLWFDSFVILLSACARLSIRLQVEKKRLEMLDLAVQTITKRVNLFERVLIPDAQKNIHHIQIALSDMERTGVIRAKLAKDKKYSRGG